MARPLRIEFPGALYHITTRGDGQDDIYLSNADKEAFLSILSKVCIRFNWVVHAYCLMSNHYHLLVETPDGNLSKGMRQLNGVYTQRFNRNNKRVGHVFQGRYKAILVQKEPYLLELSRYIVLNPVRADMVRSAKDWPWSSYRATAGFVEPEKWLSIDGILATFSERRSEATSRYRSFVSDGRNRPKPWKALKNQIYLGNSAFVAEMLKMLPADKDLSEMPSPQTRPVAQTLNYYESKFIDRNNAIAEAYGSGGYSMKTIGEYFGLHYSRVSRILNSPDKT